MSKITNVTDGAQIPKQQNIKNTDGQGFKKALDAALENGKTETAQPSKESVNSLREIQPSTVNTIEPSPAGIFDKTNFLIDKLENYSKELENPGKSLKDLEPLIASIKNDAESLIEKATETQDKKLYKIATETAIKANTEFIKFNRGDYI